MSISTLLRENTLQLNAGGINSVGVDNSTIAASLDSTHNSLVSVQTNATAASNKVVISATGGANTTTLNIIPNAPTFVGVPQIAVPANSRYLVVSPTGQLILGGIVP